MKYRDGRQVRLHVHTIEKLQELRPIVSQEMGVSGLTVAQVVDWLLRCYLESRPTNPTGPER